MGVRRHHSAAGRAGAASGELALALVYGLLTALAFALWPLGRAHDVPVSVLFRDEVAAERRWPRRRYVVGDGADRRGARSARDLAAYDHRIAVIFVAAAIGVFVMLRLLAMLIMAIARRLPRARSTVLRLAIANIHRPGALTPTVVLSLGLGLALLVTVIEIDGNLRRQFTAALPDKAPSFFFLDIQAADAERFDAFVRDHAPAATPRTRADAARPHRRGERRQGRGSQAAAGSRWVLQGDRGITYASAVPAGSRVVAGQWWGADYSGPPLVSLESKTARDLGLKIGDTITVNVLGRNMTARIANLRAVDWENLGINFVLVFSPDAFGGAPHSDIATLTFADGGTAAEETALIKAVADAFPTVTAVRVKDALDALDGIVKNLVLALGGASAITLIAAALVLGGALAAGQRFRIYDAVVLKTLGATRARLLAAYALEYLLIGAVTVLFGVAVGSLAAGLIVTRVMEFPFVFVAGAGGRRGACRPCGHARARPCRHLHGARPQARGGAAESPDKARGGGHNERIVTIANMAPHPSGAAGAFALDSSQANSASFRRTPRPGSHRDNPGVFPCRTSIGMLRPRGRLRRTRSRSMRACAPT